MASALAAPLLATNAAFLVVFGVFVVAFLVLVVLIIRWAVRHDMAGWKIWRKEQLAAQAAYDENDELRPVAPPSPRPRSRRPTSQ